MSTTGFIKGDASLIGMRSLTHKVCGINKTFRGLGPTKEDNILSIVSRSLQMVSKPI